MILKINIDEQSEGEQLIYFHSIRGRAVYWYNHINRNQAAVCVSSRGTAVAVYYSTSSRCNRHQGSYPYLHPLDSLHPHSYLLKPEVF